MKSVHLARKQQQIRQRVSARRADTSSIIRCALRSFFSILGLFCLLIVMVGCQSQDPANSRNETPSTGNELLARSAEYLWNCQDDDGGWHSETYGLLKSGQALTPFILYALLQVPDEIYPKSNEDVDRALQFIQEHVDENGALGFHDSMVLEYPVYSTAYALMCFLEAGTEDDSELIGSMRDFLLSEQFTEQRGFDPSMYAYGGWGFGGKHPPGHTGHMDLAHTRRALQALSRCEVEDTVFSDADVLLRFLQKHPSDLRSHPTILDKMEQSPTNYDGGFYFSPIVLTANKGRVEDETGPGAWRSYATATCDGLLAMHLVGIDVKDKRMVAATTWLKDHPRLDYPEGIPDYPNEYPEPWGEAVLYYHYAVRSEASDFIGLDGDWREKMIDQLSAQQGSQGEFVNPNALMKEDDPLLCTALAVTALVHAIDN